MKLNLCHNKRMSKLRGECYFRSFNAFHQRENFHLISCRIFSYYMTNSYRPGIKKFDWFKAGL